MGLQRHPTGTMEVSTRACATNPVDEDARRSPGSDRDDFLNSVLSGLSAPQKRFASKYFYDEAGSRLFDEICGLDEYYVTRTEISVMRANAAEMAAELGAACLLIEYGSGNGAKIRSLLDHLPVPVAYAPVDIAGEHLAAASASIAADYPGVDVLPVHADFTVPFPVPTPTWRPARTVAYFPGSTIGNFTPVEASQLLTQMGVVCGSGGGLLIGVDLQKPQDVLEAAYNDGQGITAAFNLNILARINRELGADFHLNGFVHRAFWNPDDSRIEMHLVSRAFQVVRVGGQRFEVAAEESILTEYSHKYTIAGFTQLVESAGFVLRSRWTDPRNWFGVFYFEISK